MEKYLSKKKIVWVLDCPACEKYVISQSLDIALSSLVNHLYAEHRDFYDKIVSRYRQNIEEFFEVYL